MLDTTAAKLDEIIRAVLELGPDAQLATLTQKGEPRWDSLAHAVLVGALESEFGLRIDAADSLELTSYEAIVSLLDGQGL